VQHEGQSLGRAERVEHDQERQADRVGEQRLVFGVGAVGGVDDRVGEMDVEWLFAPDSAGAEHVQRHACHDRRQPGAEVLDLGRVGTGEPQPGVLHGVVGLAERAERPVGDRAQARPVLLELVGEPFLLIHVTFPSHCVSTE
jgi:hypothetical protein